jgi:hypothetical protein
MPFVLVEVLSRARHDLHAVTKNVDEPNGTDVGLRRLDLELLVAGLLARVIRNRALHSAAGSTSAQRWGWTVILLVLVELLAYVGCVLSVFAFASS